MDPITLTRSDGSTVQFTPLTYNAIVQLEEALGLTFGEIMAAIGVDGTARWSLRITRQFLAACGPKDLSLEDIGTLVDDIGFEGVGAAVNGLIWPARHRHG